MGLNINLGLGFVSGWVRKKAMGFYLKLGFGLKGFVHS
jgi:hypothetical protein